MADVVWTDSDTYFRDSDVVWVSYVLSFVTITLAMHHDLIAPFSGGSWL